MGEYTAPHVIPIKMEEEMKIEAEDYELKNTGEINILIEIDQHIWTFLRTFEVGSILSLSELISLATKHSCDQCGEVFFSSTLFQGHLASHHGDQDEKCPLTGFQGDNEDLDLEMDDRLDSPELGILLPSEEKVQKINISKAAYDIFQSSLLKSQSPTIVEQSSSLLKSKFKKDIESTTIEEQPTSLLKSTLKKNLEDKMFCIICNNRITSSSKNEKPCACWVPLDSGEIECQICGKIGPRSWKKEHLKSHRRQKRKRIAATLGEENNETQNNIQNSSVKVLKIIKNEADLESNSDSLKLCIICNNSACECMISLEYGGYKCLVCGKTNATSGYSMSEHIASHRKQLKERRDGKKKKNRRLGLDGKHHVNDSIELVSCKICNKVLPSHVTIERHNLLQHEPVKQCPHCDHVSTTSKEFIKHEESHNYKVNLKGSFPCEICGKILSNSDTLDYHVKSVHYQERDEVFCSKCGKSYTRISLRKHFRTCGEEPALKCTFDGCTKAFREQNKLQQHINVDHLNIRPYECEICGASFGTVPCFKKHKLIHSDERTCICPFCGKGFKQSATLYRHKKSCHLNPDR